MSRYEARRKFGEHERGVRVARVAANSINDNKNYKKSNLPTSKYAKTMPVSVQIIQNGHSLKYEGSCNLSIGSTLN